MNQEQILAEIKRKCGAVEQIPSMGWHFVYNKLHYLCFAEQTNHMLRICVPHLVNSANYDSKCISHAVNETNKNVKFIKAVMLNGGSISLNYDHHTSNNDSAQNIIPHIINTLDSASNYFMNLLLLQPPKS
ncbi:MAG: hypothetical protein ACI308_09920 [Muribaculaceae bacterium]